MKTPTIRHSQENGSALIMTLIMTAVALILLAGILSWAQSNARLAARSNQYTRAVAGAEAAAEKVNSRMSSDYLNGGEVQVISNLTAYRQMVPTTSDSSYWSNWVFSDAQGNTGRTLVLQGGVTNYTVASGAYSGLNGYASTYTIISDASETNLLQNVTAGVMETVLLTRIPIFQFAMYSSGEMEISCGQPFVVTGRVHANGNLYVEPDSSLTFQSAVTAVGDVLYPHRDPLDTRGSPSGTVTYVVQPVSPVPALTLPIGATNTPTAVREIIEPPPVGESPTSVLGRLRYYNEADMVVTVSNTAIRCTSGYFNNFATVIPTNESALFIQTNTSFYDWRERKTVQAININIGALRSWSATNTNLHTVLSRDIMSLYVHDKRTLPAGNLGAVRVLNGQLLPPSGLTVATHAPLYVQGHYNQPNAYLGSNDTSQAFPASLVADAITVLSANWNDGNSVLVLASRGAAPTTVNAALLTGVVETTLGQYSGGMENFPRFMESWGSGNALTYNGSMVKMFPSLYATNVWGQSNVYNPPARKWAYDANFNTPSKLPPLTPSLEVVGRGQWATLAANSTNAP